MNEAFVDTAGWATLLVRSEPLHFQAAVLFQEWKQQTRQLVTTNYVLAELLALFISPLRVPRPVQFRYRDAIRTIPYVHLVHITPELDAAAWALLKSRPDTVSSIVMQERSIQEALTTDHHFEQAGFVRLLVPEKR